MSLSSAELEKLSLLARLEFRPDEVESLARELGQIVEYVALLNELDTDGVSPMAHTMDLSNVFADDVVLPSLDRELALANAPKRDDECYRVPAVLGEE